MESPKPRKPFPLVAALVETFGLSPALATAMSLFLVLICCLAVVWVIRSAPPRTITLTSGPEGSSFQRWAAAYQKALAVHGVTLKILPSGGSLDNLQRLQAATAPADLGFVPGGLVPADRLKGLVSLGSVAYQPLWVFYRSPVPFTRLSELAGKRIAVGAAGSGAHALALTLLQANGITGAPTTFVDLDAEAAAAALLAGRIDAVFLMGDSAPLQTLRTLFHAPDLQLFNFTQADAYLRRFAYLDRIVLPEGAVDLGKNLPAHDVVLLGPAVELVARRGLNSALSDLLLEVAREVHGKASLLQRRGEFPTPLQHEIPLSEDAVRYYKSGQGFLYRLFDSFWIASLVNRILVAAVPLALVLIPTVRFLPVAYRTRLLLRFYRCYRPLLHLERETYGPLPPERIAELLRRLDEIEELVNRTRVPASFGDRYYGLRTHIGFVRQRLLATAAPTKA